MRLTDYLKDRVLILLINTILFFVVTFIMIMSKANTGIILLVFIIWFVPLLSYMANEYFKVKNYYNELIGINENLEKKYLISEVIAEPEFIEGKIVHQILKDSNRNMQEHVKFYNNMQAEYREYIEAWVHEIKTPIASMMLIIENHEDDIPISMKYEMKKVEDYIDQALYYARSNEVEADYIVKSFNLESSVRNVIKKNANDFINKKIAIDIQDIDHEVYTDKKWVEFILNQIVINAIKYTKQPGGKVSISSVKNKNNIILTIEDNGVGINEKDIGRVFEKGFTGENGRIFGKSTGIGLYLCKKLCDKLGLSINLASKENEGTKVEIVFPIGSTNLTI